MKLVHIFLVYLLIVFICAGCKKSSSESFYQKVAGLWIPYQIKYPGDSVVQIKLQASSFFGAYDECVQLNEDLTFLPGSTYLNNSFNADTLEKGVYTYSEVEKKLTLNNDLEWVYKVVYLQDNDLWLSAGPDPVIVYYRRQ